jgi:hypothetical protein
MAAQGAHGRLIAARRPAKTQINTARIESIQRAKLLGYHQRGMVWQHNAARAQVQGGGVCRQIANQYRCRSAGDTYHVVVFSQPVAVVTTLFGQLSKIERVRKGFSC